MTDKEYFKPKLIEEKPIDVQPAAKNKFAAKLLAGTDNGKTVGVRLENDIVIQRIAKDLYQNPNAGFRELFNNAARFVKIANRDYGAHGKVHITVNCAERKLVIHEQDSMGMTIDEFFQTYIYLGRSDNFDRKESGQFGFGKASILKLCDTPKFEIYSRIPNENGEHEAYCMLGQGGIQFQPLVNEVPDLDSYGMRITMTCYEDTKFDKLVEYIFSAVMFKGVDTFLTLEDDVVTERNYRNTSIQFIDTDYNVRSTVAGTYKIGPFSIKDYVDRLTPSKEYDGKDTRFRLPVEIDSEDFHFYGVILASKESLIHVDKYDTSYLNLDRRVHLVGSPIEIQESIVTGPCSYWLLDVKDEGKFPPTADRERMKDDETSMRPIRDAINDKISEVLSFLNIKNIAEFKSSPEKALIMHTEIQRYLDDTTKEIARFLRWSVIVDTKGHLATLGGLDLDKAFYTPTLKVNIVQPILKAIPGATVFKTRKGYRSEEDLALLKKYGIKTAIDVIKERGLKYKSHATGIKQNFDVWFGNGRNPSQIEAYELDKNIVRIPADDLKLYVGSRKDYNYNYFFHSLPEEAVCKCGVTRDIQRIKTGGSTIDEFCQRHEDIILQTNNGPQTLKQIAKGQNNIIVFLEDQPEVITNMPKVNNSHFDDKKVRQWILAPSKEIQWAIAFYLFTKSQSTENYAVLDADKTKLIYYIYNLTGGSKLFSDWRNVKLLNEIFITANKINDTSLKNMFLHAAKEIGDDTYVYDDHTKPYPEITKLMEDVLNLDTKVSGVASKKVKPKPKEHVKKEEKVVKKKQVDVGPADYKFGPIDKEKLTNSYAIATVLYDLNTGFTTGEIATILTRIWEPKHLKNISREVTSKGKELGRYIRKDENNKVVLTAGGRAWYETTVMPKIRSDTS